MQVKFGGLQLKLALISIAKESYRRAYYYCKVHVKTNENLLISSYHSSNLCDYDSSTLVPIKISIFKGSGFRHKVIDVSDSCKHES